MTRRDMLTGLAALPSVTALKPSLAGELAPQTKGLIFSIDPAFSDDAVLDLGFKDEVKAFLKAAGLEHVQVLWMQGLKVEVLY